MCNSVLTTTLVINKTFYKKKQLKFENVLYFIQFDILPPLQNADQRVKDGSYDNTQERWFEFTFKRCIAFLEKGVSGESAA